MIFTRKINNLWNMDMDRLNVINVGYRKGCGELELRVSYFRVNEHIRASYE